MTSVTDGAFYGWPNSYYGQHVDVRPQPPRPDLVEKAIAPDYALGPHTASLGLTFNTADLFDPEMKNVAFVGQHGSWNRMRRSGYKVIFVPFTAGKPSGPPQDILTGFLGADDKALGRPNRRAACRRRCRQQYLAGHSFRLGVAWSLMAADCRQSFLQIAGLPGRPRRRRACHLRQSCCVRWTSKRQSTTLEMTSASMPIQCVQPIKGNGERAETLR